MQSLKEVMQRLGSDPYDILESNPQQNFEILKKNYRRLALKYHPDRNKEQSAKEKFIQINQAYEFLEEESNRNVYLAHFKALQEQKQRMAQMDEARKTLLNDLKRREQEFLRKKKDLDNELLRKKQFFQKKMQEQEEREKLRSEILKEVKPSEYYEELTSIKVEWQKGISFSKFLLEKAFEQFGPIANIKIEPKLRQAIVSFSSIQVCTGVVQNKLVEYPQIKIEFLVPRDRREYLLKAIKRQKSDFDLSLTTENLSRLKEVLNRGSKLYRDPTVQAENQFN